MAGYYPAEGQGFFRRLRHAAIFHDLATLREHPVGENTADQEPAAEDPAGPASEDPEGKDLAGGGWVIGETPEFRLSAWPLSHRVPTIGYQLAEPDGRRMVPERLAALGISGPDVGRLAQQGWLDLDGQRVNLAEVSEPRLGQRFAFIMDTRMCDAVFALAEGADLICEATFLASDAALAPGVRGMSMWSTSRASHTALTTAAGTPGRRPARGNTGNCLVLVEPRPFTPADFT